jgi:hypothetical protein
MGKMVAVKAFAIGGRTFWRSGKEWQQNGSVHMMEPLDLARLRQEPLIAVAVVAESVEAIADADSKATANDRRLLDQAEARAKRKTDRAGTIEYTRPEALKLHVEEIKADMAEDGTTAAERQPLKDELAVLEQRLRTMIESLKGSK